MDIPLRHPIPAKIYLGDEKGYQEQELKWIFDLELKALFISNYRDIDGGSVYLHEKELVWLKEKLNELFK